MTLVWPQHAAGNGQRGHGPLVLVTVKLKICSFANVVSMEGNQLAMNETVKQFRQCLFVYVATLVMSACTGQGREPSPSSGSGGNVGEGGEGGGNSESPPAAGEGGTGSSGKSPVGSATGDSPAITSDASATGGDTATPPTDGAVTDTPVPLPTGSPVFLAQGSGGRIIVSCDNGRSWPFHQAGNSITGDHSQWVSHGVAYGNGVFVGAFGWGTPAMVRVSRNGKDWEEKLAHSFGFSEIMFGGGMFVGGVGHQALNSVDGINWSAAVSHGNFETNGEGIVRGYGVGVFAGKAIFAGSGARRYVYSLDGKAWGKGSGPASCGDYIDHMQGEILNGPGDALFAVTSTGNVCKSIDGGKSFSAEGIVGGKTIGNVLFVDGTLHAYQGDQVARSTDGKAWTVTKLTPGGLALAVAARAAVGPNRGTWAASNRDGSKFYRSENGLEWTLATGGRTGAPLTTLIAGFVQPGGACP